MHQETASSIFVNRLKYSHFLVLATATKGNRVRDADTILTNAIQTKIHIDRCIIMLYIYIHQGVTILLVM